MKELIYHTALKNGKLYTGPKAQYVKLKDGSVAFIHNVAQGKLPEEFKSVDVYYSELAWKHGIKNFNERAGAQTSYEAYLQGISRIILGTYKPVILIAGKTELKYLPKPDMEGKLKMNGDPVYMFCYRIWPPLKNINTNIDIINALSANYNCIGDFCCGYGLSGYIFKRNGKRFVMSDYNENCIGYINRLFNEDL